MKSRNNSEVHTIFTNSYEVPFWMSFFDRFCGRLDTVSNVCQWRDQNVTLIQIYSGVIMSLLMSRYFKLVDKRR